MRTKEAVDGTLREICWHGGGRVSLMVANQARHAVFQDCLHEEKSIGGPIVIMQKVQQQLPVEDQERIEPVFLAASNDEPRFTQ